jgi:hypothetical protein
MVKPFLNFQVFFQGSYVFYALGFDDIVGTVTVTNEQRVNGVGEAEGNEFNGAERVAARASGNGGNLLNGANGAATGTNGNGGNGFNGANPTPFIAPFCLGIIFTSSLPFSKNNGKTFSKFSGFLSRKLRLLCFAFPLCLFDFINGVGFAPLNPFPPFPFVPVAAPLAPFERKPENLEKVLPLFLENGNEEANIIPRQNGAIRNDGSGTASGTRGIGFDDISWIRTIKSISPIPICTCSSSVGAI